MKKSSIKIKSNVQDISKKLDATLGSYKGFVFNRDHDKNDSGTFKVRKKGLYAFNLMFVNKIIVNGKILKTNTENETVIELSFTQYFLWNLIIFTHMILGLGFFIAVILGMGSNPSMYIFGGILIAIGIMMWIAAQNKFEKDIQEYKTLISEILES